MLFIYVQYLRIMLIFCEMKVVNAVMELRIIIILADNASGTTA